MNIVQVLSPLQVIYNFSNASTSVLDRKNWSLKSSKLLFVYTFAVLLVAIGFLIYSFFVEGDFNYTGNYEIGEMVDSIQMIGIRIAHIVSITEVLIRHTEERAFYKKVMEIDKMFESKLNAPIDNSSLRRNILKHGIITLIIYLGAELIILSAKVVTSHMKFSVYWFQYSFPFFICGIRYFQMYTAVSIIRQRLDKLVEVMDEINLQETAFDKSKNQDNAFRLISQNLSVLNTINKNNWKDHPQIENANIRRLLNVKEIYNSLWELHGILNRFIGLSMLINIGNDFIAITSNSYWIFLNFKDYASKLSDFLQITASAVWTIPHLFNVLNTALTCDRAAKGTTRMALSLHNIKIDIFNENHNTLIEQFSMQLLHQKFAFSAAGFFNVDCSLLYTIVGATTTYLIILIQFHMSEQHSVTPGPL